MNYGMKRSLQAQRSGGNGKRAYGDRSSPYDACLSTYVRDAAHITSIDFLF